MTVRSAAGLMPSRSGSSTTEGGTCTSFSSHQSQHRAGDACKVCGRVVTPERYHLGYGGLQKSRFDLVYGERIVTHEGRQHGRCKRIEVRFYIVVGVSVGHLYHVLHHLFVLAEGRFGKAHPFGDEAALFTHEFRPL